jgi:hypothetical protein
MCPQARGSWARSPGPAAAATPNQGAALIIESPGVTGELLDACMFENSVDALWKVCSSEALAVLVDLLAADQQLWPWQARTLTQLLLGGLDAPPHHPLKDASARVADAFGRIGVKFGLLRDSVWYGAPADCANPARRQPLHTVVQPCACPQERASSFPPH